MRTGIGKRAPGLAGSAAPAGFHVEVHAPHVTVPADVRAYIVEQLAGKLRKWRRHLTAVHVHVQDENGAKGGIDKVCRMEARLSGAEPALSSEKHHDLRAVLDLTIDGLEEVVRRHVERFRVSRPRDQGRKLVRRRKLAT